MEPIARSKAPAAQTTPNTDGGPTSNQLFVLSALFMLGSVLAASLGVSYFMCPSSIPGLSLLCKDTHYKYLVPLLVPTTTWFVIANWIGWQYFRYA